GQVRNRRFAGTAPRGPEVDDVDLAGLEGGFAAIGPKFDVEARSLIADLKFLLCHGCGGQTQRQSSTQQSSNLHEESSFRWRSVDVTAKHTRCTKAPNGPARPLLSTSK